MATLEELRKKFPQYNDMSDEKFADAFYQKYYSDIPRGDFNAKLGITKEYSPANNEAVLSPTIHDVSTGIGDAMTFGLKDEILAGAAAPFRAGYNKLTGGSFDLGAAYDTELANQRKIQKTAEERSPIATTIGQIAGGFASPAMAIKEAPATVLGMAGRTAGQGALAGGAYGFGSGEGEADRLTGAAGGAAIGGAIGGVLGGATGAVSKRLAKKSATTGKMLEDLTDEAYGTFDDLPAYKPEDAAQIATDLRAFAKSEGISKSTFPRVHSLIDDIEGHIKETGSITPRLMDLYRRRLNSIRKDPSYSAEAGDLAGEVDNLVQTLGSGELEVAKSRFRQKIQLQKVENAVRDAYETAARGSGNVSQHLKVAVGKLLRKDRNAMTAGKPVQFDAEMRDQMQKVVDNGTIEGMLNWLGRASPDSGLGMLGHTLTALSTGVGIAQLPVAAGSLMAKKAGAGYTAANVDTLKRIIAKDPDPMVKERARMLLKQLTKGLSIGAQ